jgi:hypothetical protein
MPVWRTTPLELVSHNKDVQPTPGLLRYFQAQLLSVFGKFRMIVDHR